MSNSTTRLMLTGCAVALLASLAACGEQVQTATPRKADQKAWQGADDPFVVNTWKAGDKASWEDQMRTRNQAQNEYNRVR